MTIDLPWPPSVNEYWHHNRRGVYISSHGKEHRTCVKALCMAHRVKPMTGRLSVVIEAHPPDSRRRDLDNALKATLDSLQHGGAYLDDGQIDHLSIHRCLPLRGGKMTVHIRDVG